MPKKTGLWRLRYSANISASGQCRGDLKTWRGLWTLWFSNVPSEDNPCYGQAPWAILRLLFLTQRDGSVSIVPLLPDGALKIICDHLRDAQLWWWMSHVNAKVSN